MRVLIDQNISYRIIQHIDFLFDEVAHVKTKNWIDWNDYDIFKATRYQ